MAINVKKTAGYLVLLLTSSFFLWAISDSENDNFSDGMVANWIHPISNPDEPRVIATGGPLGAGDQFLRVSSDADSGNPGSRLAMVNRSQWAGDYNAVGPAFTIQADVRNSGAGNLSLRLGVQRSTGGQTRFVSTNAAVIAPSANWQTITFSLTNAEMTSAGGSQSLADVLSDVSEMRIISATTAVWAADEVVAQLDIDNIRVASVPVQLMEISVD